MERRKVETRRKQGWEDLLAAHIDKYSLTPFRWGRLDCVRFSIGWVRKVTGLPVMYPIWGTWTNKKEAMEIRERLQFDNWGDLVSFYMDEQGFKEVPPLMARRGDVVVFMGEGGATLGLCDGKFILSPSSKGLVKSKFNRGIRAWRID